MSGLQARGRRVEVASARQDDLGPYRLAVRASAARLARWNAVDEDDLVRHLRVQSDLHRTFIVRALEPGEGHGIVGKINVTNVVRGRFSSATLGYDAYDPYVGRGLFAEGLRLVVDLALRPTAAGGMGLHRVEANVQPGNVRSARVLRSLGFRHEGETPRMLYLAARGADADGVEAWRDHERYAVTREEWPADPWTPHRRARRLVLVNGLPGAGVSTVGRALAAELVLPLLPAGAVGDWGVLAHFPTGAVVEGGWLPGDEHAVAAGLQRAGFALRTAVEVWCDVPVPLARSRARGDRRPPGWWDGPGPGSAGPLGLGRVLHLDTSAPLDPEAVARLALRARALAT